MDDIKLIYKLNSIYVSKGKIPKQNVFDGHKNQEKKTTHLLN